MELIVAIIVALAVGVCTGVLLKKWADLIDSPEEEESPFFTAENYKPVKVHRIGRHRSSDSFPISNVNIPDDTPLSQAEEQELEDTMGFLAAVKAEVWPDVTDTQEIASVITVIPPRAAIEAPTWAQEHVWHKSLAQMVDEIEQAAYSTA